MIESIWIVARIIAGFFLLVAGTYEYVFTDHKWIGIIAYASAIIAASAILIWVGHDYEFASRNETQRTITVYTADGNVLARYEGLIDIKSTDDGYLTFDYNGEQYVYYNCFAESKEEAND